MRPNILAIYNEIDEINKAYDLFDLERGMIYAQAKPIINRFLRDNHPDKAKGNDLAAGNFNELRDAKELLVKISKDPQTLDFYHHFQATSLAYISNDARVCRSIIKSVLTYDVHVGDVVYQYRPTQYQLDEVTESVRDSLLTVTLILSWFASHGANDLMPTVINRQASEAEVMNANNYTIAELARLHNLIVSGSYQLDYPLRYANEKLVAPAHQLLVQMVNLESRLHRAMQKASNELKYVEYCQDLWGDYKIVAIICLIAGAIIALLADCMPLEYAGIMGVSCFSLWFLPLVLLLPLYLYTSSLTSNHNAVTSGAETFIGRQFFQGINVGPWTFDPRELNTSITEIEASLTKDVASSLTPEATILPAEFSYTESTGRYVGSFWSAKSNKPESTANPSPEPEGRGYVYN